MPKHLGDYMLLEALGGGGMGRVFKAVHCPTNRMVAVKLVPDSLVQSPESVERVQREVQALARLSHPNIVTVHEAGTADGTHFYVMDLVEGDDFARLVKENGPLPVEQALDCILQAARGLEYAHAQGIVHRAIKPSNLILDYDGTVKILDLGLARFQPQAAELAHDDLVADRLGAGDGRFPGPRAGDGHGACRPSRRHLCLGCTLWFLLSGQPLFGGETVMERLAAHREDPRPSLRQTCPERLPGWMHLPEDDRQAAGRSLPVGDGVGFRPDREVCAARQAVACRRNSALGCWRPSRAGWPCRDCSEGRPPLTSPDRRPGFAGATG